jgi:RNA polymerase sigma-70 factor, ECF subfamily
VPAPDDASSTRSDARESDVPASGSRPITPSDEDIILAVQRGDERLAGEVYDRLVSVVDHTLYRVFGRREVDHDDLVQAAFEQIILTLQRQTFARACSLRTWASTVASHVGFNALRARRRERSVLEREGLTEGVHDLTAPDLERQADARSQLEHVRNCLLELTATQAEAVFLHDVLGHDLAEIAVMTGTTVAAAQSRLVRGRHELFRMLGRAKGGSA